MRASTTDTVTVGLAGTEFSLHRDTDRVLFGGTHRRVSLDFRGKLELRVTAASAGGGEWTCEVSPPAAGPGQRIRISIYVFGRRVKLFALPKSNNTCKLAEASLWIVPDSSLGPPVLVQPELDN